MIPTNMLCGKYTGLIILYKHINHVGMCMYHLAQHRKSERTGCDIVTAITPCM